MRFYVLRLIDILSMNSIVLFNHYIRQEQHAKNIFIYNFELF
jgi:hypothetical protein